MAWEHDSTTRCRQSPSCDTLRPSVIFLVDRSKLGESVPRLGGEGGMIAVGLAAIGLGLQRVPGKLTAVRDNLASQMGLYGC